MAVIDERKVRIMTALAIYDKYYGKRDRRIEGHFRKDYVYKNNSFTRLSILVGFMFILGFYALTVIFASDVDLITFDYMGIAKKFGIIILVFLVVYSMLGSYVYGRKYDSASRRLSNYNALLRKLEEIQDEPVQRKWIR